MLLAQTVGSLSVRVSQAFVACLPSNMAQVPLSVQKGHDNAKCSMEAGQGVTQRNIGPHRGSVCKAIDVPAANQR